MPHMTSLVMIRRKSKCMAICYITCDITCDIMPHIIAPAMSPVMCSWWTRCSGYDAVDTIRSGYDTKTVDASMISHTMQAELSSAHATAALEPR